ncbi:hypothetical protein ACEN2P_03435 [Pedobacter psychrotolerans]|uniref:hypothetical protein n=1 Tax=Pedobacter psychrotolerans TaxID=1843235 RepID=UPI003F9B6539
MIALNNGANVAISKGGRFDYLPEAEEMGFEADLWDNEFWKSYIKPAGMEIHLIVHCYR